MAATEAKSLPRDINMALGNLRKALEKLKERDPKLFTEANIKIVAHLRAVTSGKFFNLPQYHAAETQFVSDEDKFQMYKLFFNALIAKPVPDYSKFGSEIMPGEEKAPVVPPTEQPAHTQTAGPTTVENVPLMKQPVKKAIAFEGEMPEFSELLKGLVRLITPHLKIQVDESAVESIVQRCLANGSFPTERVEAIVKKTANEMWMTQVAADKSNRASLASEDRVREIVAEQLAQFKSDFGKTIGRTIAESLGADTQ